MKTPLEPNDAWLQTLVEETQGLAQTAAAYTRARRRKHFYAMRLTAVAVVTMLSAGVWHAQRTLTPTSPPSTDKKVDNDKPLPSGKPAANQAYVKVYRFDEVPPDTPVPPDASEREKRLLAELADLPLLIVKNAAGEVTRVHVFER